MLSFGHRRALRDERDRTVYRRRWSRKPRLPALQRKERRSHVWYLLAEPEQVRYFIANEITSLGFVVIGAGRLGTSLALALRDRGAHLLGFSAATPEGRLRAEEWLGGPGSCSPSALVAQDPELYIIAVPDDALPDVASELAASLPAGAARQSRRPAFVLHTSGATSVAVLDECRAGGLQTLAFHPLQTFTDPLIGRARFAGAGIAVTPSLPDPGSHAEAFGFALAVALGARPFLLPDDRRTLYHAAAAFACNYLVTLEHHAEDLFVRAGLARYEALSLFLPLVAATLDNVAAQGTVEALTGPLSRGDLVTIRSHLLALRAESPELLTLYRALGLATLPLLRERRQLGERIIDEVEELLERGTSGHLDSEPGA